MLCWLCARKRAERRRHAALGGKLPAALPDLEQPHSKQAESQQQESNQSEAAETDVSGAAVSDVRPSRQQLQAKAEVAAAASNVKPSIQQSQARQKLAPARGDLCTKVPKGSSLVASWC